MSFPEYETLICNRHPGFAEIRLNRPHRLNAVVETLYRELLDALLRIEQDADTRALILSGEGRAFCVGADLKEHAGGARGPRQQRLYLQLANDVCQRLQQLNKPVVAAVQGYALGAGAEMAVSCDFMLMASDAEIGFPEVSIGTCVGGGVSHLLPRLTGLARARELILLGQRINGGQAREIGLASHCCAAEQLQDEAQQIATRLSSAAPVSMQLARRLLNETQDYRTAQRLELDAICACMATDDWQEGVDAFAEKRPPVFRGC